MAGARAGFNAGIAEQLVREISPRAVRLSGSDRLSSRFAFFQDESSLYVVAGPQEERAVELALVYGLALRAAKDLVLILPPGGAMQSAVRAAWLDVPIRVFSHLPSPPSETVSEVDVGGREGVVRSLASTSFVDAVHHLGDRAKWVEELTSWAGAHPYLSPAHRPDNRSWHCMGLRVLRVARTGSGVTIRAGIGYTIDSSRPGAAVTLNLEGPLTPDQLESCQDRIDDAVDERYWNEGSMYKADEHWLQAVLREEPSLVGIEAPALREVAAFRCSSESTTEPEWGRGFIDLVGADPQGSIRLVETKLGNDDLLVLQGLDYYIWAQQHRPHLARKLSLPAGAPLELHFVVGGKAGGAPGLSNYVLPQLEALSEDISWRVHFIRDWFDGASTVAEVHRHDSLQPSVETPRARSDWVSSKTEFAGSSVGHLTGEASTAIPWSDPVLAVGSDSLRTARYRALQSWFREVHLGLPPGRNHRGRMVASMLPSEALAERPGANFLTSEAFEYASVRAPEVMRDGGSLDRDRLLRNMLSSMPMCFNVFGYLRSQTELPSLLADSFGLDLASVDDVQCEWAPPRADHLGDRTAFDAFVTYRTTRGTSAFLAIETKYTEPFSQKEYDSQIYKDVTGRTGLFKPGAAESLVGRATNQLWRMAMLAASMLHRRQFEEGAIAVVSLGDDRHAKAAVDGVRAHMLEESFVKFVSLESLTQEASTRPALREWATTFSTRYLDLSPVLDRE